MPIALTAKRSIRLPHRLVEAGEPLDLTPGSADARWFASTLNSQWDAFHCDTVADLNDDTVPAADLAAANDQIAALHEKLAAAQGEITTLKATRPVHGPGRDLEPHDQPKTPGDPTPDKPGKKK